MKENFINDFKVKEIINEIKDNRILLNIIESSVIIVTYNNNKLLLQNLDSLNNQTIKKFEILLIDNNDQIDIFPLIKDYPIHYIKLNKNYGPSLARNIGIKLAMGKIVIFLDDDAITAEDFVEQHIRAYQLKDIFGLRGKARPINPNNIYNYFAYHYDYGDKTIPCYINLEGNSSFKREILVQMGGFNLEIAGKGGHEGLELSYRIIKKYKDLNKLIYYPNAIIYHDYSNNFNEYIKKLIRHKNNKVKLENKFRDIFRITENYKLNQSKIKKELPNIIVYLKMIIISKLARLILRVYSYSRYFCKKKGEI